MFQLNFPKYSFKVKSTENKRLIFDSCRRKYVPLTPEEWVRQNMVQFLIHEKNSLKVGLEMRLLLNSTK